jgi:hypothetical protein
MKDYRVRRRLLSFLINLTASPAIKSTYPVGMFTKTNRMRNFCSIIILLFSSLGALAQEDSIVQRLIMIGDAGQLENGRHPELELIARLFSLKDSNTAVIYLGDNIYPLGLPEPGSANYELKKKILDLQIDLLNGKAAKGIMIPGNHDWMKGGRHGLDQVGYQEFYVKGRQMPNMIFTPESGCPGPVEIPLNESVVMIVVDSQWWLQRENRPGETSDCECKTEDEVVIQLKDMLYRNRNKLVVYASHHPFKSYGEHGGYFTWKQHIFPLTELNDNLYIPLPVLGSIYAFGRGGFGNIQDLKNPEYKDYTNRIDEVLSGHPYCIRIAGHEHALQFIEQSGQQYIVSGAGSKNTQVRKGPGTVFADEGTGFGVLELLKTGEVRLKFFSSKSPSPERPVYAGELRGFINSVAESEAEKPGLFPDSMQMIPAPYYKARGFKRWLLGSNYREEWTTPLKVRTFNIQKEKGGLVPVKRGGGFQSRSLRLEDSKGNQYVLRSIEKFPDRTLPEEFRQTFVKDAVVDGVSASYPYAALSVPPLAAATGIPHANPEIVYIPDDPALKQYRTDFRNGLYLFEEREPADLKKTYSSTDVFEKLQEDNDNSINQEAVLWARLLDMFIMDFDRHEDQWRWGKTEDKKAEEKRFFPIPRDRDQPFFINNGVIPKAISRPWILPKFQGFRAKARNIKTFNFNARYFDRSFLNGLNEATWVKAIDSFIPLMTDKLIDSAIAKQPPEVQNFHAKWIANTLKQRRTFLKDEMIEYYHFLEKEVDVVGTDKREFFDVVRNDDGSVKVRMFKINKEGKLSSELFNRTFYRRNTKEIRLWGLGAGDSILITGNGSRTIKLRVIGGGGPDQLVNNGIAPGSKTVYYDFKADSNSSTGSGKIVNRTSDDPEVNRYNRKSYNYNIVAPLISAAYNPDDGVFLGLSVKITTHGFRKEPHKLIHQFRANKALATGAYNFRYKIDAVDVFGKTDIVAEADIKAPDNVQNFFGIGNETEFVDEGDKDISYYRSRYNLIQGFGMMRTDAAANLTLLTGPVFQRYWIEPEENIGRFISQPDLKGIDTALLNKPKGFLGWQFQANVDTRNNEMLPSRGIFWKNTARVVKGVNEYANDFAQLATDLSLYLSFNVPADLVVAARVGAGINYGKYEFFQAQYLSGLENLRGFRKYRFAGDKMFYNNIDLRIRIADFRSYLLPGSIGLLAFNDIGRVWVKDEKSGKWHNGYGGGIWLAPGKRYVIAACYGFSSDGGLPFVTLGFQF